VASCHKINLSCSRVTEIAVMTGFDCVWLDMEHVANDWATIENQIRACKLYDVDTIVRMPRGSYSDYIKPLELYAAGIMVPHLMNLEEARQVVWQTRFHPIGRRPLNGGNPDGAYCMNPVKNYIRQANQERLIMAQIEDPETLDDLDEIAKLEGIDMIFFGPGDFSQAIGSVGQMDHPMITETRKRIADVCKTHGKFAGTVGNPGNLQDLVDMGYQFVSVGSDVGALSEANKKIVSVFSQLKCN